MQCDRWLRIEAPHFVAAALWRREESGRWRCVDAAPILRYMVGWDAGRARAYLDRRGWTWGWV